MAPEAFRPLGRFRVADGHPALPGHFPGRPVVPGTLVLEEALALLGAAWPDARLAGLVSAKFLRPLLPGAEMAVEGRREEGSLRFNGHIDGVLALVGAARLG